MFFISENSKKRIFKIHNFNNKASQHSDIATKIIKSNSDLFSDFLYVSINSSIKSLFPSCLKTADVTPIYRKGKRDLKNNYRPASILPGFCQSYIKEACSSKYPNFLKIFSQKTNVDSAKATSHSNFP